MTSGYRIAGWVLVLFLLGGCGTDKLVYKEGKYETTECSKELGEGKHFLAGKQIDRIVVDKSEHKMYIYKNDKIVETFRISLGKNPNGHKLKEGDFRTPEGLYLITGKQCHPKYYRMISISYPNQKDICDAKKRCVPPGSGITIHAQPFWNGDGKGDDYTLSKNWTNGCIAITNDSMDFLWYAVKSGTPIQIRA